MGTAGLDSKQNRGNIGVVFKALLLESVHPDAKTILESAGLEVATQAGALDESELITALEGVHILAIRSKTQITAKVLEAHPQLVAIGVFGIGTNHVDLAAAAERGIAVFNAPFSNTRSVVELAIAEIIGLSRRLTEVSGALHAGTWDKSADGAHEIRGRTLGIVGYGNIGTQLSVLAENLGLSVIFYDTSEKLALGNARRVETLDELLGAADIVTLHVDGRSGNAGLFGAEQFNQMKRGSLFLNLSRGFVVDYEALKAAIEEGRIVGAAVDVFPNEPKKRGDNFDSPLRGLPNTILTPHIGGSTEEAQEAIGHFVAGKLKDYLATGSTTLSVNLPALALPASPGGHRLTLLHRNTPGVLAKVNATLAEYGENIQSQLLATSGDLGYVVTDASDDIHEGVIPVLEALPETVRLRVLN